MAHDADRTGQRTRQPANRIGLAGRDHARAVRRRIRDRRFQKCRVFSVRRAKRQVHDLTFMIGRPVDGVGQCARIGNECTVEHLHRHEHRVGGLLSNGRRHGSSVTDAIERITHRQRKRHTNLYITHMRMPRCDPAIHHGYAHTASRSSGERWVVECESSAAHRQLLMGQRQTARRTHRPVSSIPLVSHRRQSCHRPAGSRDQRVAPVSTDE